MAATAQSTTSASKTDGPNDPSYIPRGPVTASLQFYCPPSDNSKPFNYPNGTDPPPGLPRRNFGDSDIPVTINDIRGREAHFNLSTHAFATITTSISSDEESFTSDASIKAHYYPEVESLLLRHVPGAQRVYLFDHTLRRIGGDRPPVLRTHIDQTPSAALGRVRHLLPDEADELLKSRVRIVNVWRPLNGPVQCSPLAFADSESVTEEAVVAVEHRYADRVGETLSVKYEEGQRWYYWSGIRDEERILLQIFDSEKGGRCAHSAFVDPRSPVGGRQRESIEVRGLIFG